MTWKIAVAVLILCICGTVPGEPSGKSIDGTALELLFEASLQAQGEVKPYVESEEPFSGFSMRRDLIAQGEGTIRGAILKGEMTWSQLAIRSQGEPLLKTHVSGWITTEDGAEIFFKGMGNAALADPQQKDRWVYTSTLVFEDADKPYDWLTSILLLWVGEFNVKTGVARYRAYVPRDFLNSEETEHE